MEGNPLLGSSLVFVCRGCRGNIGSPSQEPSRVSLPVAPRAGIVFSCQQAVDGPVTIVFRMATTVRFWGRRDGHAKGRDLEHGGDLVFLLDPLGVYGRARPCGK